MSALTTKDGIEVRVGQVWRDCERRNKRLRFVQVVEILEPGRVEVVDMKTKRRTPIRVHRMHKYATGYQLVRDV